MDNLYTAAENPPGHVYESAMLPYEVQDLRPGFAHNNSASSSSTKSDNDTSNSTSTVPRRNF